MVARLGNTWVVFKEEVTAKRVGIALGAIGFIVAIGGSLYKDNTFRKAIEDFYANVGTELLSIAIAVVVIQGLSQRRETNALRGRLIREMGKYTNNIAVTAVNELRTFGWLTDNSLQRADLGKASLQYADLHDAHLQHADLREANLQYAKLMGADLQGAQLWDVNLQEANLEQANLQNALMDGADLKRADLTYANLQNVALGHADLEETDLIDANLQNAYLEGANLDGADLTNANLQDSTVTDEQLTQAISLKGATMPDGSIYDG